MTTTKYSNAGVSPRTNVYAERQMLKWAEPVMVLDKFGMTRPMPKNKTQTIKFRRPRTFTAATTPLVEGVTPSATAFRYDDVEVTIKQYGQIVEITDVIEDTHEDPVLNDAATQAGQNIGRTMEALNWGVLRAGTNVVYANGGARNAVNTPISLTKIRAVVRALEQEKAMQINKMLKPGPNYATRGVEPGYVAVCHSDCQSDIRNLQGFIPCVQYGSMAKIHDREFGSVENVRFITSPDLEAFADLGGTYNGSGTAMVSTTGANADVYPILFFGQDAYGVVPLKGQGAVQPSIIRPGVADKSDPLGQRGYVGWKSWHACVILNQLWMSRLEVAVTEL
jgi:N4-gp56 family major capsid protein